MPLTTEGSSLFILKDIAEKSIEGQEPTKINELSRRFISHVENSQIIEQAGGDENSIPVTRVTRGQFAHDYNKLLTEPHTEVSMAWQISPDTEPILNIGAGPCLILYIHDKTTGEMISGHYPLVYLEDKVEFTRNNLKKMEEKFAGKEQDQTIAIPDRNDIQPYTDFYPPSLNNYYSVVSEVRARKKDNHDIKVYLFGQHMTLNQQNSQQDENDDAEVITSYMRTREQVLIDFEEAGLSRDIIHDHRKPVAYGESEVDYTLFDPRKGIEYYRGEVIKRK